MLPLLAAGKKLYEENTKEQLAHKLAKCEQELGRVRDILNKRDAELANSCENRPLLSP